MPENHSRAGKRVERVRVNDDPHEKYRWHDPWTGEHLSHGIPLLEVTNRGNIVEKEVTYEKIKCPDCGCFARYSQDSEPICPNCGLICAGKEAEFQKTIIRDAKAAGRIDGTKQDSTS